MGERNHIVRAGEHLAAIACQYGFADVDAIWKHPSNAELREKRNPSTLLAGDVIVVPEREPGQVRIMTGRVHTFVLRRPKIQLRIVLQDVLGTPIADATCSLSAPGSPEPRTSASDGLVEWSLEPDVMKCTLKAIDEDIEIGLGCLDPIRETSGVRARLQNLGYFPGDGEPSSTTFRSAVEEFQCDHLGPDSVTGTVDGSTLAKLEQVHGG